MLRALLITVFSLAPAMCTGAEKAALSKFVNASVVFREDTGLIFRVDPAFYKPFVKQYPHILNVFIHLENIAGSDINWVADNNGISAEAQLLDAEGRPVKGMHPIVTDIPFQSTPFCLPYGSRLDWYVSGFDVPSVSKSSKTDGRNHYVIAINGSEWFVPIKTAAFYSLKLRVRGYPWAIRPLDDPRIKSQLLFDLPPAKIKVTR